MEIPVEAVTLMEVKNDGQTLVLIDGRELDVDPGDITTAILWLPTTLLEISDTDDNRFFNLSIKVQGTNQQIRANWK
jgi:hypothetical protein